MNLNTFLLVSVLLIFCLAQLTNATACTSTSECGKGNCENSVCVCNNGYVSYGGTCNYQQKEKLTAFLLSFFLGSVGADWFYLAQGNGGYITAGVFKLLTGISMLFGLCGMLCCVCCISKDKILKRTAGVVCIYVLFVLFAVANAIWSLVDWIRVLADAFKDGNGVALKNW